MTKLRVLVADDLSEEGLGILRRDAEVEVRNGMPEDELRETLPGFHALIVRSATKVTARSLETADVLSVIGRAGIGVDNIDLEAATERGIVVMNTPEAGAVTTAELAIALMMSLARNIPAADASMKAGRWDKSKLLGTELRGQTLGVLGLGRIGSVVADRGRGLKMKVVAHDPFVDADRAPSGVRMVTFDELLAESDFLSVHVPLTDETRGLIGAAEIAKMKSSARIMNGARGGIVNEEALCDALEAGEIAGAALDVFEREPLPEDNRLRLTKNLILTPHLGASTREAKRNVSFDMANQVITCLKKGVALNGINVPRVPPSQADRIAPFLTLARNLASFLLQVYPGRLRSLRLTLQGKLLLSAKEPLRVAMLAGALGRRADKPVTPVNADRIAEEMGVRYHVETSTLKRDFVNLIRIETLLDDERHFVSGTVLGRRHGRMVELDHFLMDAIPEGPLLVTFHHDEPGVIGRIASLIGSEGVNISRLQLGVPDNGSAAQGAEALGLLNLSSPISQEAIDKVLAEPGIIAAHSVRL